jgi:phosphate transport system substrate-binding protein
MEFAKDRVVFAVSNGVDVSNLTSDQLADIFSGKIQNWSQVGGGDAPIRVFSREAGDCSLKAIQGQLLPFKDLSFAGEVMYRDYEMLAALENNRNSIGFLTSSSLIGKNPKAIMLDGIEPSVSNVKAGKYTLAVNYAVVYKEDLLDKTARKFIDYVHSSAGRKILEDHGMIPVSP